MKIFFQLFILLLPNQLTLHFWPDFAYVYGVRVDYLAPTIYLTEIVWTIVFFSWLIEEKKNIGLIRNYFLQLLILLVFAAIHIYHSLSPEVSFLKYIRVFEFLSIYIYVKNQKNLYQTVRLPLLISLIFILILSCFQILNNGSIGGVFYFFGERTFSQNSPGIALANLHGRELLRPYATFGHPNAMAGYALVVLFLIYKKGDIAGRYIAVLCLLIIFISFSQNAWLSLILSPIIFYLAKSANKGFEKFARIAATASFFLVFLKPQGLPKELIERIKLNNLAGKLISENPILGIGLGNFVKASVGELLQPVHNIFLLITAEAGLMGLLLFIYFISKRFNPKNSLALVAIVLTGFFDHYWVSLLQNFYLAAVVIGWYND